MAIFARAPVPGKAKTRLRPLLGSRGAAEFQAALISDAMRKVNALTGRAAPYFFLAGRDFPVSALLSDYRLARQRGRGLGERLERAFRQLLHRHTEAVVIGTDSPTVPPQILRAAFRELRFCDAVLGPCPDGGYYLIGLRRLSAGVFRGIRWGSACVFRHTLGNLLRLGFSCSILEAFGDVDRPEDVHRLAKELVRSATRRLAPATWRFLKAFEASREDSRTLRQTRR